MGTCKKIFIGSVTGILAFIFISAGVFKLAPKLSPEVHNKISKEFVTFAKLHPAVKYGYQIEPKMFMTQIGVMEVLGGIFLLVGPRITKMISCLILSSIMVGAMYFIQVANKPREDFIVPAAVLFLTFLRLNMFFSPTTTTTPTSKQQRKEEKKQKKKSETKKTQ